MCHGEDNNQTALEYSELSFLSQTNDKNMYVTKKIWCDHTHSSEINVGLQGYLTLVAQTQRLQLNDVSLNRVTAIIMGTYQIGREEKKDREHKEHSDKRTN